MTIDPIKEFLGKLKEEKEEVEPPRETKGFESLVCEEEFEAIKRVKETLEDFINVHNICTLKNLDKIPEASPYARVQLMLLGEVVNDAQIAVAMMYGIHTCDKEFIDGLCKEKETTINGLEAEMKFNKLKETLLG